MNKKLSHARNDTTGNRSNNLNHESGFASTPTRYLVYINPDHDGTSDMSSSQPMEDYASMIEEPVELFNSRLDLSHDLPSTRRNRWTAQ